MEVWIESIQGTWRDVANRCRATVSLAPNTKKVSANYMHKLYLSEHSPIRVRSFIIRVESIPSWVATHFVRHHIGVTHYISTQREDRTGSDADRNELPQGALVNMELHANAQAIINISRKRLCNMAHKETRKVWQKILEQIKLYDEPLYSVCVKECVYRGFCPEMKGCKYCKTDKFKAELEEYRSLNKNFLMEQGEYINAM